MISLAQSRKSCQPFHLPKLHVHVDLYYNRAFCEKDFDAQSYAGSYSRKFRPDYTIAIYSDAYENERAALRDGAVSFLHFDAKYRLIRLLGKDDATEEALDKEKAEEVVHHYRHGDLMKMHTYRDAIRRTIGSYVIYPGDEEDTFSLYDEILPGVGAFVLKPSKSEAGEETLRKFLEDVIQYRAKNLPRLKLMMQAEESVIREPQDTLPYLAQTSTPPVSVSQDKFCIIGYLKHDYYYNHLTKDSPLTTRTEFLFYFHVIQGKTSAGTVDQKRGKLISRAELIARPEPQHEPAELRQRVVYVLVVLDVARQMLFPIRLVRRDLLPWMRLMSACMPEIAVDKDRDLLTCQCDVRRAWQPPPVFPIPQSLMPQGFAQQHLRLRIFRTDTTHRTVALLLCQDVQETSRSNQVFLHISSIHPCYLQCRFSLHCIGADKKMQDCFRCGIL